jgi:hypothetical protein
MSNAYRNNHYVPVWYQRRFLVPGTQELLYRDLQPEAWHDSRGVPHTTREIKRSGFTKGFAQQDLYTQFFGSQPRTLIEENFFGEIDRRGRQAVDHFGNFKITADGIRLFEPLLYYMSTQKLRTPKGLDWLKALASDQPRPPGFEWLPEFDDDRDALLQVMVRLRGLFAAIWTECIWLIASAENSQTKFIVSDHPITTYNRRCGPRSTWCRGFNDPDIRLHGTHTIFPLSYDKILMLSNRSWMQNPYQSETEMRPNPRMMRNALFNFLDVQTDRILSEREVREINFIIMSRASRYIAAADREWLCPETHVSKSDWHNFGHGYLLMPDPRSAHYGGTSVITFTDGRSLAVDEYGRQPWQPEYSGDRRTPGPDWNAYQRFQGEFSRLFGADRRGRAFRGAKRDEPTLSQDYFDSLLRGEQVHRARM